jgi:hypothetical protein
LAADGDAVRAAVRRRRHRGLNPRRRPGFHRCDVAGRLALLSDRRPQSLDTTAAAEDRQFAVWLAMTPAQKLAAWAELQAMAEALAEAGIRREHPHASDREVFLRRVARVLDRATMLRCYGWAPDEGAAP